jgi:hypothetical protein
VRSAIHFIKIHKRPILFYFGILSIFFNLYVPIFVIPFVYFKEFVFFPAFFIGTNVLAAISLIYFYLIYHLQTKFKFMFFILLSVMMGLMQLLLSLFFSPYFSRTTFVLGLVKMCSDVPLFGTYNQEYAKRLDQTCESIVQTYNSHLK